LTVRKIKRDSHLFSMKTWLVEAKSYGLSASAITLLVGMSLFATLTEMFGVGVFLPIFQFMRMNGDVETLLDESSVWGYLIIFFERTGIPLSFENLLLLSFVFFLARQIFTYIRLVFYSSISQRLIKNIRVRMFNAYLDSNTSLHDSMPVGNLVNAMTTEATASVGGIMAPLELVVYIVMALGYLLILSAVSWQMTLASSVVLLLASLAPKAWIRMSADTGIKLADANTTMSSFLVGRLRSPRLVRLAGTALAEKDEFRELTESQRKHAVFGSILQARTEVVMEPIVIALSLAFLYFAFTVMQMQIEMIGLYLVVALRLMPVIKGILTQWQKIKAFSGSVQVIKNRLLQMDKSKEVDHGTKTFEKLHGIKFENVSYSYPSEQIKALSDISLEIKSGTMTALVGPSGSGKSTLIDLLLCLRFPQSGQIYMGNNLISDFRLSSLREAIAYVPQSPQIFDGTVIKHIRYGKKDASDEEVREAARLAAADRFILQLSNGYETRLGEDAVRLSGGQRQRLDLARALIRKAPILILDEPTSNLDVESEDAFRLSLSRIRHETDTTIIVVTHSLRGVTDADQIVVLNHGKIEMVGHHSELICQDGWYADAWKLH